MSVQIEIISGFLGAGKTTLINKLLPVWGQNGKTAIIENEYGSISIDGSLIPGDLPMREIYGGCICCTLAKDFIQTIQEIVKTIQPDRIIIEPTGIGQLSDVLKACVCAKTNPPVAIHSLTTIVDISQFQDYLDNFGSFYGNQIENAGLVLLSHYQDTPAAKRKEVIKTIRNMNPRAVILDKDWLPLPAETLASVLEDPANAIAYLQQIPHSHQHRHSADCTCGCHDHSHGHSSQQPQQPSMSFDAWGCKNVSPVTIEQLEEAFAGLKSGRYGKVARGKGILQQQDGKWLRFDFTPKQQSWQYLADSGPQDGTSKVTVIGVALKHSLLAQLFPVQQ